MLDKFIRQHEVVTQLTGEEEEYCGIIRLIATHRYRKNQETVEDCYQRLMNDSKRFIQIYHKRGGMVYISENLFFWFSRYSWHRSLHLEELCPNWSTIDVLAFLIHIFDPQGDHQVEINLFLKAFSTLLILKNLISNVISTVFLNGAPMSLAVTFTFSSSPALFRIVRSLRT